MRPLFHILFISLLSAGVFGAEKDPSHKRSPVVFHVRGAESEKDHRYEFDTAVVRLALEKTTKKYGPFEIRSTPAMNTARALEEVNRTNSYSNLFVKFSYEDRFKKLNMITAGIPIDYGIVGYRVCFTNADSQEKIKKITELAELKKLTIGQGIGWSDVQILRDQGFKVEEVADYENLFKMVAANRFDLFCRGAHEILNEWNKNKHLESLVVDEHILITYPLFRFLYTHSSNKLAARRIDEGLRQAHKDGSLQKIWDDHLKQSVEFAKLAERKVFRLDNLTAKTIDKSYFKFLYDPFKKK